MPLEKEVTVALIQLIPTVLVLFIALVLAFIFRKPLVERVLPRISGVKFLGVEITLLKESLDRAVAQKKASVSEGDRWSALQRAENVLPVIRGSRILWVDDEPDGNRPLVDVLDSLGANVDQTDNSDEALKLLHRHRYHVVISDIDRKEGEKAGLLMVQRMRAERVYRWTIFYVTSLDSGVPDGAFNITNRPDELLHFVMDVLERERWGNLAVQ